MKKLALRAISICLAWLLLLGAVPVCGAYTLGEPYTVDLSALIENDGRRRYVQMMIDYHLRTNSRVQQTLEAGHCAMFLFEGCSDNMDDPQLRDLSYYRVSAVCVVIKLDAAGEPFVIYFNDDSSTLPDRALSYGAWSLENIGEVGPATICDGTYELYSVRHAGVYEALQIRTDYSDETVYAVYMIPEGYVTSNATYINIHTRTVNHILQTSMWSAGCILIGGGDLTQFTELMASTYYSVYEDFRVDRPVGTVTLDRYPVKNDLYSLYQNRQAVDTILAASRVLQPNIYLNRCRDYSPYETPETMQLLSSAELMTLPCGNGVDARSVPLRTAQAQELLPVTGTIRNTEGELWAQITQEGEVSYIPADFLGEYVPPEPEPENGLLSWLKRIFG